jgi:hypothetical protein
VKVQNLVSGKSVSVVVASLGTATIELSDAVAIAATPGVFGAVVVLIEGQISDLDVRDPKNLGSKVKVRFR